jgi:glyoxylase-like metal-dependent hydrolase (beta-lactamase superfamily II)
LKQLTDHISILPAPFFGIDLFLYVLCSDGQVALIDSGINTTPDEHIFPALADAQLQPGLLICTHGHVDHFGGNAAIRARYPGVQIALHHADVSWAEDHLRHLHEMYLCMPQTWQFEDGGKSHLELCGPNTAIDIHLEHGQQVRVGTLNFKVVHAPGHAPGHVILHEEQHGIVICGDVALGLGVTTPAGKLVPPYYYDPTAYLAGIDAAVSLQGRLYCTGHNGALNYQQMLALAVDSGQMVDLLERHSLAALSQNEPRSLADVVRYISLQLPQYEVGFHLNASAQAHLLRHCREKRARAVIIGDLKHYLAV